jgi:hypothetical protein
MAGGGRLTGSEMEYYGPIVALLCILITIRAIRAIGSRKRKEKE